ncbi:hydrogenase maturation protease [Glycomyces sp. NPDC047369]
MMPSVAIVGIGNKYRQDDRVGLAVVDRLREQGVPPWTRLAVCDGEPSRLVELWSFAVLAIVVDALEVRSPVPGRIHRLDVGAVAAGESPSASRGPGLGTAVRLACEVDRMPERLVVYGVEMDEYGFGMRLSGPVRRAAGHVAEQVGADLAEFAAAARIAV